MSTTNATEKIPAVPPVDNITPLTPGKETSEYALAQKVNIAAIVVTAVGTAATVITPMVQSATPGSKLSVWGSISLAILGLFTMVLNALGYTKARTDAKTSANTK